MNACRKKPRRWKRKKKRKRYVPKKLPVFPSECKGKPGSNVVRRGVTKLGKKAGGTCAREKKSEQGSILKRRNKKAKMIADKGS